MPAASLFSSDRPELPLMRRNICVIELIDHLCSSPRHVSCCTLCICCCWLFTAIVFKLNTELAVTTMHLCENYISTQIQVVFCVWVSTIFYFSRYIIQNRLYCFVSTFSQGHVGFSSEFFLYIMCWYMMTTWVNTKYSFLLIAPFIGDTDVFEACIIHLEKKVQCWS